VTGPGPRPLWDTIVGQSSALDLLERALAQDRVAHAYAFLGPSGVGRRLGALAFAQRLLCPRGGCGTCSACRRVAALRDLDHQSGHPDCRVIAPTPPADNPRGALAIRIEDVRVLAHWAALTPHEGPRKVFVLDDADRMTLQTPQALLKTLEEPPPRTVLILILANPRALPPTVLSRCQRVRFRPLAEAEVARVLEERGAAPVVARRQARWSHGQVGRVASAELEALEAREAAALALLRIPPVRQAGRLDEANLDRDRLAVAGYLDVYWRLCRDALCVQAGAEPGLLFDPDRAELPGLAERTPRATLLGSLATLKDAWLALEGNVSPRLCLERALLGLGGLAA